MAWSAYFWFIEIFSDQFLWNWNSFCCCLFSLFWGDEDKWQTIRNPCGFVWTEIQIIYRRMWLTLVVGTLIEGLLNWTGDFVGSSCVWRIFVCVLRCARLRLGGIQWFCVDQTEKCLDEQERVVKNGSKMEVLLWRQFSERFILQQLFCLKSFNSWKTI